MFRTVTRTLFVAGVVALFAMPSLAEAKKTFHVDNAHSQVIFSVKHLGAGLFYGQFLKVSGQLVLNGRSKSTLSVKVKAGSVFTNSKKRDKHLRGPDFFNAKQFPIISFKSTKIYKLAFGRYRAYGILSFHGVKKKIKLFFKVTKEVKDPWGNTRIGALASISIKRKAYGLKYMPKGLGNKVKLIISLELIKSKK